MFSFVNGDVGSISYGKYSETYVTTEIDRDSSSKAIKGAKLTYSERYRNDDGTCNKDLVKKDEKIVQERFNKAKSAVNRKMTDTEKALVLYDYLITSADYPESLGKKLSTEMKGFFGAEHTYRLGGDEFLGVRFDITDKEAMEAVESIRGRCEAEGYHVSFGIAGCDRSGGDMNQSVKMAEEHMYREKKAFYGESARL